MFLQIHTLTSYHASLLNRDDAGLAKRIPFGNAPRLRVSSQCLKRHWREALKKEFEGNTKIPMGIRTRHFFSREVRDRLVEERKIEPELAEKLVEQLANGLLTSAEGKKALAEGLQLKQPILFGRPEADFLVNLLAECAGSEEPEKYLEEKIKDKENKRNFKAMLRQAGYGDPFAGIEGALFGRFITSDILSRYDAAVHVAHSFSVHPLDTEVDYFTVVDDLKLEEETGAAHAGDMELGAGLFYGYVVVDVPLLVSNFSGAEAGKWREKIPECGQEVREILKSLVKIIATVSPGAKLGATAPYAYSDFMLLESGKQQPRSLANAYLQAISFQGNPLDKAIKALFEHLNALDEVYGKTSDHRVFASTRTVAMDDIQRLPLSDAVDSILDTIF